MAGRALVCRQSRNGAGSATWVHSFHSYFRGQRQPKPIIYDEVLRDGEQLQRPPRCRYSERNPSGAMTASFVRRNRVLNIKTMPTAVGPEGLPSETEIAHRWRIYFAADSGKKSFLLRSPAGNSSRRISQSVERSRRRACASGGFAPTGTVPDDIRVHQCLLGYASDLNLLPVALQPHGIGFPGKGIQIAATG